jgi:hypothetical protein
LLLVPSSAHAGYFFAGRYIQTSGGTPLPVGQTIITPAGQTITSDGNGNLVRSREGTYEHWVGSHLSQILTVPAGSNRASEAVGVTRRMSTNGVPDGYYKTNDPVTSTLTNGGSLPAAVGQTVTNGIKEALASLTNNLISGIGRFIAIIGYLIFWLANAFLYVTALALNASFEILVTKMGSYTELWAAVREGWKAIRDVGNTLFIFVLLYAAFNTVLGRKEGLDLVPRIIVVALLVNFSYLFATTLVIDPSNQLAQKIFESLVRGETPESGFSGKIAQLSGATHSMKLTLSFSDAANAIGGTANPGNIGATDGFAFFVKAVFGSAFMFALGGFFIAIIFTLLARFVTLVILVVVSALAFLAYLLPKFRSHSSEWWTTLIGQAFYAPAVFLLLLVVTGIAQKFNQAPLTFSANFSTFESSVASILSLPLSQFFKFMVLLGLLFAAMKLARKLSEVGSSAVISFGQRAQSLAAGAAFGGAGFALRGSLGRLGSMLSDNDGLKRLATSGGVRGLIGRQIMGVAGRAQGSSFDFRKTGVAAAIAAQGGVQMGGVSDKAAKGWKGIADAREKAVKERIDAVKKWDISGKDKKDQIEALLKAEAGSGSHIDNAEKDYQAKLTLLSTAQKNKASQDVIDKMRTEANSAKGYRDDLAYTALNKKLFGVSTDSRDLNYSTKYARSMQQDALTRARLVKTPLAIAASLAGAASIVSGVGIPATLAAGAFVGGRAVSGAARSYRDHGKKQTVYKKGKAVEKNLGVLGAGLANPAILAAAQDAIKKEEKLEKERRELDDLDAIEQAGEKLTDAQKRRRDQLDKKLEKLDNEQKEKDKEKKDKGDKKD